MPRRNSASSGQGTKSKRGSVKLKSKGKGRKGRESGQTSPSSASTSAQTTSRQADEHGHQNRTYSRPTTARHNPGPPTLGGRGHSCDGIPLHNTLCDTASKGQSQMVTLNERLASFLSEQRTGTSLEIREFRTLLQSVTKDADRVRESFEKQITSLQLQIEKLHEEHAVIYSKYQSCKLEKIDRETRWKKENHNFVKVEAELEISRRRLLEGEQLKLKLEAKVVELESDLGNTGGNVTGRYDDLIKKYESVERYYYEEKKRVERLEEALRIETEKYQKARVEWEKRIHVFQETIVRLEKRVETSTGDMDFSAILEQLREHFSTEMHQHHHTTDEALHESLQKLQYQMAESRSAIEGLRKEKSTHKKQLTEYKSKISVRSVKLEQLEKHMKTQTDEVSKEREKFSMSMVELEERSMEFYHQYLEKTRECTEAREIQIALQTEIQGYKAILDAEEHRSHGTGQ